MAKIGQNLKALRIRRQLSIRDLALRAGVTHTTISLIEKDRISPTIDTLQAIVDALGSKLTEFLSGLPEERSSPFYPSSELLEIGNPSSISYQLIGLNHPNRTFQFLKETYAPGATSGEPVSHIAQEAGYVLSGSIMLIVDDQSSILQKGDGYYFDSQKPHSFYNIGTENAEIVSAISPPSY